MEPITMYTTSKMYGEVQILESYRDAESDTLMFKVADVYGAERVVPDTDITEDE